MQRRSPIRIQMVKAIEAWKTSGQSQQSYCQQHRIKYHVFHYYYKRYRDEQATSVCFSPVEVVETCSSGAVELQTASGHRLIFHQPVSSTFLKSLIN